MTSYVRTDKYIFVPGLLNFHGKFARLKNERQRKSHSAIQQVKHNRTEICEIKHVSQLHEKVAYAALVNQKIKPAKVHVQNCRNRTSVSTRNH